MSQPAYIVRSFAGGPRARRPTPGPEHDLVTEFIASFQRVQQVPRNCATTIFLEPFLESGAPDVVAVTWHMPTARALLTLASGLRADSLRLLHFLSTSSERSDEYLEAVFGRRRCRALVDDLVDRDAIRRYRGTWVVKHRERLFAVRKIVALEAKMDGVTRLLHQASANRWFASESYALFPRMPTQPALQRAAGLGVGVWVHGEATPALRAEHSAAQPISYASWLFNGWIAQHARDVAGGQHGR